MTLAQMVGYWSVQVAEAGDVVGPEFYVPAGSDVRTLVTVLAVAGAPTVLNFFLEGLTGPADWTILATYAQPTAGSQSTNVPNCPPTLRYRKQIVDAGDTATYVVSAVVRPPEPVSF